MFNFYDSDKNPFMVMMNHMAASAPDAEEADAGEEDMDSDSMRFLQQAFTLQMQIARSMLTMPFTVMKGFAETLGSRDETESENQNQSGFKLGGFEIPPELLQMVMQMDMKPENLEKLQKVLDFVFSAVPEPKPEDE